MASILDRIRAAIRPSSKRAASTASESTTEGMPLLATSGYPTPPEFDMRISMSALRSFPWVWACVQAIGDDLGSLPLIVERPTPRGMESVPDAPVLALLDKPSPTGKMRGHTLRRQVYADLTLSRNVALWTDAPVAPMVLQRVHPDSFQVVTDRFGLPTAYVMGTALQYTVPRDQVIHIRGPCWDSDASGLAYGTSPVEVLSRLLNTELAVMDSMRRQSKLARPDGVMSPGREGETWGKEQVQKLKEGLTAWQKSEGGILVNPWNAKFDIYGTTPKDMEYTAALVRITAATLAVFGVTPTRVGIQSANYATAQMESLIHWQARQGDAATIDDGLTALARMWPGYEDVVVRHDFSRVPALQESRSSGLARVSMHVLNGMDPSKAYEAEGFDWEAEAMRTATGQPAAANDETARHARSARYMKAAYEYITGPGALGMSEDQVAQLRATLDRAMALRAAA